MLLPDERTDSGKREQTHTLIGRACGPEPDSCCAQVKIGYYSEPTPENLRWAEEGLHNTYESVFGEQPTRVAVAVLPYSEEHDGDDA